MFERPERACEKCIYGTVAARADADARCHIRMANPEAARAAWTMLEVRRREDARAEEQVRALARRAKGRLHDGKWSDLADVYRRLGMPDSNVMSTGEAGRFLYACIKTALEWQERSTGLRLGELERHLMVRWLADDAPLRECASLLFNIKEAVRMAGPFVAPLSESDRWLAAFGAAKDYRRVHRQRLDQEPHYSPRERSVANGIRAIRRDGIPVAVIGGRAHLTDDALARAGDMIDQRVARLGGIEFIEYLFEFMTGWFDPIQKRHHAVRRLSTWGAHDGLPVTPVGYLLNLAAKHVGRVPDHHPSPSECEAVASLATRFVDLFDLHPYHAFDGLFLTENTLIPYLREIVLYDGSYSLVQARLPDMPRLLRGLFDWVPSDHRLGGKWTVAEFARFVELVEARTRDIRGPGVLSRHELESAASGEIDESVVRSILDTCSHDANAVNPQYTLPWHETTLWKKPFVNDHAGHVFLDPSWCAPAFYEVLAASARADGHFRVDDEIGPAFERVVRRELRARGVTFSYGEYTADGIDGECDLVIETRTTIVLVEMKKKPLRRAAKSGDPVAILADLAASLFTSQEQAARAELLLHRKGYLDLEVDGAVHRVERRDRHVERVSLTLLDYGSLQDRGVLFQILALLSGATFRVDNPEAATALRKLEEKGSELLARHQQLEAIREVKGMPFFNCWFLSLGHLLVMLDHIDSDESFWNELRQTRHMMTGSRDFYFEYSQARRIRLPVPEGSVLVTGGA